MFAALRDRDAEAVRAAVRADIDAAFMVLVELLK
jgi:DNA-binding GntR family transcriptional regulator